MSGILHYSAMGAGPPLGIIAKDSINNQSDNHHGIEEYLRDPDVARLDL